MNITNKIPLTNKPYKTFINDVLAYTKDYNFVIGEGPLPKALKNDEKFLQKMYNWATQIVEELSLPYFLQDEKEIELDESVIEVTMEVSKETENFKLFKNVCWFTVMLLDYSQMEKFEKVDFVYLVSEVFKANGFVGSELDQYYSDFEAFLGVLRDSLVERGRIPAKVNLDKFVDKFGKFLKMANENTKHATIQNETQNHGGLVGSVIGFAKKQSLKKQIKENFLSIGVEDILQDFITEYLVYIILDYFESPQAKALLV
ncbi:hypothetical protein SCHIN_v1c08280 [Spiroplasma chinense]|uniref:Uncharacterized protein n=1 Tax=Spiroplasma chinense TaxID=216932 RepID=A0A5B9Y5E8_9MOLU|nr:hypothetical protein [Spiroplasma chinense]QEH62023.1 hypothetical protein SCHIN_v1c08280 [Spiroplasma chinense]